MQHTDNLIAAYERHAGERDAKSPDPFKESEKGEFRERLNRESRHALLEVGCGTGRDAAHFRDEGFAVTAVDTTPAMVDLARQKGIDARHLDCYQLDQIPETFDAVYTMNCLLHIPNADITRVLGLISDRLETGGLIYLGLWGGEDFEGIWENDRYEPKRFFSLRSGRILLGHVQEHFALEYYRRLSPRPGSLFHSLIARKV